MKRSHIVAGAVIYIGASIWTQPEALAHSWYPLECCSDRDCHPVAGATEVAGGYRAEGIFYPMSLVRPSKDGKFHACYIPNTKKPLCLFVPLAV